MARSSARQRGGATKMPSGSGETLRPSTKARASPGSLPETTKPRRPSRSGRHESAAARDEGVAETAGDAEEDDVMAGAAGAGGVEEWIAGAELVASIAGADEDESIAGAPVDDESIEGDGALVADTTFGGGGGRVASIEGAPPSDAKQSSGTS